MPNITRAVLWVDCDLNVYDLNDAFELSRPVFAGCICAISCFCLLWVSSNIVVARFDKELDAAHSTNFSFLHRSSDILLDRWLFRSPGVVGWVGIRIKFRIYGSIWKARIYIPPRSILPLFGFRDGWSSWPSSWQLCCLRLMYHHGDKPCDDYQSS